MSGAKGNVALVAGTPRMKAGPESGNLVLLGGNADQVINYLGKDVDVVVMIFWK